ncbi:unnamed protein product [Malus baccata var. baccata]
MNRGNLKINFDGSVINNHVATGFVVRDENGRPILAGARNLGENSNNVAECVALRDALWMARCRGFKRIQNEGDLKLVIDFMEILFDTRAVLTTFIGGSLYGSAVHIYEHIQCRNIQFLYNHFQFFR